MGDKFAVKKTGSITVIAESVSWLATFLFKQCLDEFLRDHMKLSKVLK